MAEVGAEISFRAFQGLQLVKAEPGIQSKIPAGNGSAHLALRTLHPFSLASLAFALAVPKAQPTLTGLLTPDPSLLLIFSPSTEKQSANLVSTTAGVQSQIRGPPSRPPHHHLSGLSHHHPSLPHQCPLLHPPSRSRVGLLKV